MNTKVGKETLHFISIMANQDKDTLCLFSEGLEKQKRMWCEWPTQESIAVNKRTMELPIHSGGRKKNKSKEDYDLGIYRQTYKGTKYTKIRLRGTWRCWWNGSVSVTPAMKAWRPCLVVHTCNPGDWGGGDRRSSERQANERILLESKGRHHLKNDIQYWLVASMWTCSYV